MIKDGRRYLVHCTWNSGISEPCWEILRWGRPNGLSDFDGIEGWINNSGFKVRVNNCTFGEFYELDNVIVLLRCTKRAGIDYGKSKSETLGIAAYSNDPCPPIANF